MCDRGSRKIRLASSSVHSARKSWVLPCLGCLRYDAIILVVGQQSRTTNSTFSSTISSCGYCCCSQARLYRSRCAKVLFVLIRTFCHPLVTARLSYKAILLRTSLSSDIVAKGRPSSVFGNGVVWHTQMLQTPQMAISICDNDSFALTSRENDVGC